MYKIIKKQSCYQGNNHGLQMYIFYFIHSMYFLIIILLFSMLILLFKCNLGTTADKTTYYIIFLLL